MNNDTSRQNLFSKAAVLPILGISLMVGTLDILTALADYYLATGKNPLVIFKFIASGILGTDALSGGNGTILLGLTAHYFIALTFTVLFFVLFLKTNLLPKNKIVTGVIYGTFIWTIMNFAVLPLSNTPKTPFNLFNTIKALLILIVMIGLPLSFLAKTMKCFIKNNHFNNLVIILPALFLLNVSSNAQGYKSRENLPTPVIFGDGIISTIAEYETHPAFSPSGDTVYFLRCAADLSKSAIYYSEKINGKWSKPELASFSGHYFDADPFVAKDGKTLYFTSNRPINEGDPVKTDTDIWKVEKTENSVWGKPVHLGSPVNSPGDEHYPTLADNGNMYFGSSREGGKGGSDIYFAKFTNGKYAVPENQGDIINTANNEYEPFIEINERFLIFMATVPKGLANADFYISYNQKGKWSSPVKLSVPLNSPATEWSPKITRDGKYFFFGSTRNRKSPDEKGKDLSDIYQVDVKTLNLKK